MGFEALSLDSPKNMGNACLKHRHFGATFLIGCYKVKRNRHMPTMPDFEK
jgi:hypothetical protein